MRASQSVTVDRPVQEVFDFLARGTNNPLWRPAISLVTRVYATGPDTGPGVGTTYLQRIVDVSGRTVEETYQLTRFERPLRLDFEVTRGSTRELGRYTLAAIGPETTHVEFTLRRLRRGVAARLRRHGGDAVHDHVSSIAALPAAMRDGEHLTHE